MDNNFLQKNIFNSFKQSKNEFLLLSEGVLFYKDKDFFVFERNNGDFEFYKNDLLHQEEKLPAIKRNNGSLEWWVDGKRHREDGPAVINTYGTLEWWVNGERHREGGPAIINDDEYEWWFNGKKHRNNSDSPAIKRKLNGEIIEEWWVNGVLHRKDGPAIKSTTYSEFRFFGKLHNLNGYAKTDLTNGIFEWWVDNIKCESLTIFNKEASSFMFKNRFK